METPLKTFIIYAHEDLEYKTGLERFLRHLVRKEKISLWSDKEIKAGEYWDASIQLNLSEAEVILMLVSVDFYNSDYIQDTEFTKAKAKFDAGEALLIPILVRYCPWKSYDLIRDLQALPPGAKSIDTWLSRDQAFTEVAEKLEELIDALRVRRAKQFEEDEKKAGLEREKQQKKQAAEKAEQDRNRRDNAFWKQIERNVAETGDLQHKIALYNTYLQERDYHNHQQAATDAVADIQAELEASAKIASAKAAVAKQQALEKSLQALDEKLAEAVAKRDAEQAASLPEMVLIKGGTFNMGDELGDLHSSCLPVHVVTVDDFYLGKYAVTVAEFKGFIEASGYKTDAEKQGSSRGYDGKEWVDISGQNWRHNPEGSPAQSDHPVIHVSWNDASAYCKWLEKKSGQPFRLPTEAEWEFAAGNGNRHTLYSWGNEAPSGKNGGNVADQTLKKKFPNYSIFPGYSDGYVFTAPVGSFDANDFGLHDMTGNVWEWCADWHGAYSATPKTNPSGALSGSYRVIRGGSWHSIPEHCRIAYRSGFTPNDRYYGVGFRLARTK